MSLKKIPKEPEKKQIYFNVGRDNFLYIRGVSSAPNVDVYGIVEKLKEKLKPYCELKEHVSHGVEFGKRGGPIPPVFYTGKIDASGGSISVEIMEMYVQPGRKLCKAQLTLRYDTNVSKRDVSSVRKMATDCGLAELV